MRKVAYWPISDPFIGNVGEKFIVVSIGVIHSYQVEFVAVCCYVGHGWSPSLGWRLTGVKHNARTLVLGCARQVGTEGPGFQSWFDKVKELHSHLSTCGILSRKVPKVQRCPLPQSDWKVFQWYISYLFPVHHQDSIFLAEIAFGSRPR